MQVLTTLFSTFSVALRRLWHQRLLMLCLWVGLVAAVGLLSSIPLYSDAVNLNLLQGELTEAGTYRPPFAFLWRYIGAWNGDISWEEYGPVNRYLEGQAAAAIALPLPTQIRHVQTAKLRLFPTTDSQAFVNQEPLLWASIGFISHLEEHIQLLDGEFPAAADVAATPSLIHETIANQLVPVNSSQ